MILAFGVLMTFLVLAFTVALFSSVNVKVKFRDRVLYLVTFVVILALMVALSYVWRF